MNEPASVRVERNPPVTTVILSRRQVRNAVDRPTADALVRAFLDFEKDSEALVAVLFGDSGAFCAGADLKALSAGRGNRLVEPGAAPDPLARSVIESGETVSGATRFASGKGRGGRLDDI